MYYTVEVCCSCVSSSFSTFVSLMPSVAALHSFHNFALFLIIKLFADSLFVTGITLIFCEIADYCTVCGTVLITADSDGTDVGRTADLDGLMPFSMGVMMLYYHSFWVCSVQ